MKVSIIIPVFNESARIEEAIDRVFNQHIPGWTKEIIIVDDGSTDDTGKKLKKWRQKCRVVTQPFNLGKGSAVTAGVALGRGDVLLIQDADLEYDPADYPKLLDPFSSSRVDIVYGSRFLGPHLSTMFIYELGNKFVTLMTNVLFNTNITDMETGYKAFRKKVIDGMVIHANRFDFEPEFTAKALLAGYQIYEVPISYHGRKFSEGKKLTWRDGVIALFVFLRCRLFP